MRPKPLTWLFHGLLLFVTFLTCTVAGCLWPFGYLGFGSDSAGAGAGAETYSELIASIPHLPIYYAVFVFESIQAVFGNTANLSYGMTYAAAVLFILVSHEMGHYIACRLYGVHATLPFFIPTPPLVGPAGTMGAFIRIVSPMPSRKAVFDIGVAGPLAGFFAMIPVSIIMILTLTQAPPISEPMPPGSETIIFTDPIWIHLLAAIKGIDLSQPILPNPFYSATWLGLLVTALNLIPSGQLDGGHAIYAVFGEKFHRWTGRIAFVVMAMLSISGLVFFNSPAGLLFALILAFMMRVGHPRPADNEPLDKKRIAIAILTFIVFVLCFAPFPIRILYAS